MRLKSLAPGARHHCDETEVHQLGGLFADDVDAKPDFLYLVHECFSFGFVYLAQDSSTGVNSTARLYSPGNHKHDEKSIAYGTKVVPPINRLLEPPVVCFQSHGEWF